MSGCPSPDLIPATELSDAAIRVVSLHRLLLAVHQAITDDKGEDRGSLIASDKHGGQIAAYLHGIKERVIWT